MVLIFAEAMTSIEAAWSLQEAGAAVTVLGRRGRISAVRRVRGVEVVDVTAPEESVERCAADVTDACRARPGCVVLALDDPGLLVLQRITSRAGIRTASATGEQAVLALDKRLQIAAAQRAGFSVPRTWTSFSDVVLDGSPLVAKAALAVEVDDDRLLKRDAVIVTDPAGLESAARSFGQSPVLIQPLLRGVGEGVFGLGKDRKLTAVSGHRRLRMMNPAGSGASACESLTVSGELKDAAGRFVSDTGWSGCFMIELLTSPGAAPWFMELNGRPWGSLPLARARGLEYVAWSVAVAVVDDFDPELLEAPPASARHLGRDLVHLMQVYAGPRGYAGVWPSRWTATQEVLSYKRGRRLYNYRKGEERVFIADTLWVLRQQVLRRRA